MKKFVDDLIKDIKTELDEEFDRNFERKAFFTDKWEAPKLRNDKGSVMARNNHLRRSIKSIVRGKSIHYQSSLPYASLHNEGGEIVVTKQMKKFFWAMYYKSHNAANIYTVKTRKKVNTIRTRALSEQAQQWKNLALMKVGQKIKIEQRQFIGHHPQVDTSIENVLNRNVDELNKRIQDLLP